LTEVPPRANVDHAHRHIDADRSVDDRDDHREPGPEGSPGSSETEHREELAFPDHAQRSDKKDEDDHDEHEGTDEGADGHRVRVRHEDRWS
jgi:hypothetical protein